MPTSLVSTGVQFPDSTTQTTALPAPGSNGNVLTSNGTTWTSAAPSGSGGATQVGSVCLRNTANRLYYAANPAAQTASPYWSSGNMVTYPGASLFTTVNYPPKYSTYYGGWLTLGQVGSSLLTDGYLYFSADGINWVTFLYGPNDIRFILSCTDGTVALAVDETNGRIFLGAQNTGNDTTGVLYSSAPATQDNNTWTYLGFDTSGQGFGETPAINSMEWVQFTSTTANGAVVFANGTTNISECRIYTIAAGATTATLRVSYNPFSGYRSGWMVWNKAQQRIAVFHSGSNFVRYSAVNSFTTWSNTNMPSAANAGPGSAAMSGSRLACITSGTTLRYTSDYSTWTTTTTPQSFNAIWHNGTRWVGMRGQSINDTSGIYSTNNTDPTSFTRSQGWYGDYGTNIAIRSN